MRFNPIGGRVAAESASEDMGQNIDILTEFSGAA